MSATAVQARTHAYEYRKGLKHAIAAPVASDSDSDFNAGAYVPEKPRRKRKAKLPTSTAGSSRGARRRRRADVRALQKSPLFPYFGDALNLSTILSDEANDEGLDAGDEDEDEDEDEHDDDESGNDSREDIPPITHPLPSKTLQHSTPAIKKDASQEDSVTESDSEQLAPPPKRSRMAQSLDEQGSVTESDSGAEIAPADRGRAQDKGDDTMTESDSDAEVAASLHHEVRPSFVRNGNQPPLGPLALDPEGMICVPASINTFLRDYQRDGVRFFYQQYKAGLGALLGDDMGKTIQVISFLSAIMHKRGDERDAGRRHAHVSKLQDSPEWAASRKLPPANASWPTCLIVAPSTVVYNWEREFETWGYFEVGLYLGAPKDRERVLNDFKLGRLDVVLTSFDVARRDIDVLDTLAWTLVIVDECHRMKNPRAKLTEAFARFTHPRTRIGLTGTAIQNSYDELWTILDWTNPDRLGSHEEWETMVMNPLKEGQSRTATDEEQAKAHLVARALHDKLLPRFWLRRTKDIIKDQLPRKLDNVVFCPLTPKQIKVYKRVLALPAVDNMIRKDELCDCGSKEVRKKCCYPWQKGDLLRFISMMIKISNHLCLILPHPKDTPDQIARSREMTSLVFPNLESAPRYGTAMVEPDLCGKWLVLDDLLKQWRQDRSNKVLIFTKSVRLLDVLQHHLNTKSYGLVRLDGSTKQTDRMSLIDKFHADPDVFVFLISTLAGGTGLNLTGANKVIIFDPNWNPAHDLQAMDRAYRFGQTRDVAVYRLLGAGSIEELIYARQLYKQQQMKIGYEASIQTRYFEGVQDGKKGELFGLKNIFALREDSLTTKKAIESAHVAQMDWTLANKTADKKKAKSWVYEAEVANAEDDLAGLGAFLFDEDARPATMTSTGDDEVDQLLGARGIKYSHQNDKMIAENPAEKERMQQTVKDQKRKRTEGRRKPSDLKKPPPVEAWPPKRKHHKPKLTHEQRLAARQLALFDLGYVRTPDDHAGFALEFNRKSPAEQEELLAKLDRYAAENPE